MDHSVLRPVLDIFIFFGPAPGFHLCLGFCVRMDHLSAHEACICPVRAIGCSARPAFRSICQAVGRRIGPGFMRDFFGDWDLVHNGRRFRR